MNEEVSTSFGRLRGRSRVTSSGACVEFLGIPYAAKPDGALRFAHARPAERWNGVRVVERPGPVSYQFGQGAPWGRLAWRVVRPRQAEDCLYLNVWAPAPAQGGRAQGRARPVMLFLHGGGFVFGSGSSFVYKGAELAARYGVVVVTANYRLGALGCLDLTDQGSPGNANFALGDQMAALRWVFEEIEAFGGDPESISLVGQSAGAMSVQALLSFPELPFQRAIVQSAAVRPVAKEEEGRRRTAAFLDELERLVRTADGLDPKRQGESVLEYLRRLPVHWILRASDAVAAKRSKPAFGLPWRPSVDGQLLKTLPRGDLSPHRDLLIGTVRDEWKLFSWSRRRLDRLGDDALLELTRRALREVGVDPCGAPEILRAYRCEESAAAVSRAASGKFREGRNPREPWNSRELWNCVRRDQVFRGPAVQFASQASRAGGRAYLYDLVTPLPGAPRRLGSCHGSELPLLFGTWAEPASLALYPFHRAEVARQADQLQGAWIDFLSGGGSGLEARGWRPFDPAEASAAVLSRGSWRMQEGFARTAQSWCREGASWKQSQELESAPGGPSGVDTADRG